ncbi:hypothetical protein DICPUDRAFT_98465 [Dictyostelium purpureum]|uniref:Uncharacterized protein n=1 Tax=Dictyostelium purpureum TaxID=5786 RepID=F0ZQK9_DICPU|nr:uncharacterized protein DICPUDRAFT_98465 [Dictyostelium purpureum]EGC33771.1 hypothetical protein DICPUDRAFT_98465 [Dictyostelium purpureum]|eukprot:XP_003289696.1 hypothetical protein DICPUDRAFT_98465 [Dictyostelium purpureum]
MDSTTRANNYSLANTNRFSLLKDLILFLVEITGESLGSLYDTFTLDAPQAVKRQIDNSVSDGNLGQILKVIQDILKETKYLFNTPTSSSPSSSNTTPTPNNFNTMPKSFSSPNFYSTNSGSEENISLSSSPNGSSIYSTPSNSTFISSSSPTKQPFIDSANSTPNGGNSPNTTTNLTADQVKIKQLELELLKFKEAAATMMNLKNASAAAASAPPPPVASLPPPPPPPPPPVFKQTSINLKRGVSSPNLSTGGSSVTAGPPSINFSEILLKKPLLKKVNLDRSPGGTPSKERPKGGVEDVFKAILHKFKNENQSPCKGQTDDESSDSDFE